MVRPPPPPNDVSGTVYEGVMNDTLSFQWLDGSFFFDPNLVESPGPFSGRGLIVTFGLIGAPAG